MKFLKAIAVIFCIVVLFMPDGVSNAIWNIFQYIFAIIALIIYLPTIGKRK